jgi:hypothetical membrane protein
MREEPTSVGALVWIFAVQFFIIQVIVALAWSTPFSLSTNFISDLGNTACAAYPAGSNHFVCSPWHAWMNASFVTLGLTIVIGTVLNRKRFGRGSLQTTALIFLALSGVGVLLYPENTSIAAHKFGAGINFVGGNLGIALLGIALFRNHQQPWLAGYSTISGTIGLVGTVLLVQDQYLHLGIGGMERVAAYPIPLWLIVAGAALLRKTGNAV